MTQLKAPKEVRAKKQHCCDLCCERINERELYVTSTHVFDGDIYNWKTHKHCEKLATRLKLYEEPDGINAEYFRESVSEEHYRILTDRFANNQKTLYADILEQIRYVAFRQKMWFVIRHFNKTTLNAK